MSEDLSVKYYQTNKESLQKKDRERYQCLSKKKKKKSDNMVVHNTKIYQKMKRKNLKSIEKTMTKMRKNISFVIIRSYLYLENLELF